MSDVQLSIIIGKMTDERINKTDNPLLTSQVQEMHNLLPFFTFKFFAWKLSLDRVAEEDADDNISQKEALKFAWISKFACNYY